MRALHLATVLGVLGLLSCGEEDSGDAARCWTDLASFDCPSNYAPGNECRWAEATVTWGRSQTSKQPAVIVEWATHGFACFFEPTSLVLEGAMRWGDAGTFCDGGAATVRAGEAPNAPQTPPRLKSVEKVESCASQDGGADVS